MSSSSAQPEKRPEARSSRKVTTLGRMRESALKELNESLCCVVINASTCLRMLAADPPNVEGARETARRTICCSNRTAEAVSHLHALFSATNKSIEMVAPSIKGTSTAPTGGIR